jgi:hypothetical protein
VQQLANGFVNAKNTQLARMSTMIVYSNVFVVDIRAHAFRNELSLEKTPSVLTGLSSGCSSKCSIRFECDDLAVPGMATTFPTTNWSNKQSKQAGAIATACCLSLSSVGLFVLLVRWRVGPKPKEFARYCCQTNCWGYWLFCPPNLGQQLS